MLTQCLEIKARGCCMHVFLVSVLNIKYIALNNKKRQNEVASQGAMNKCSPDTGQHDLYSLFHIHAVEIVLHKALPHCHVLVVYTR